MTDADPDALWRDDPELTELVATLEALRTPASSVTDARLDAIERRITLPVIAEPRAREPRPSAQRSSGRSRTRVALLATAAALIAVVVLGFGVFGDDRDRLVIAAADGVDVVLPDGDAVDGRVGLELPDGTVLRVTGFVDIEGTRFGPGTYLVDDSRLERLVDEASDTPGGTLPSPGSTDPNPNRIPPSDRDDNDHDGDILGPSVSNPSVPLDPGAPVTTETDRVDPAGSTDVVRTTDAVEAPVPTTVRPGPVSSVPPATVRPDTTTPSTAGGPSTSTAAPTRTTVPTRPTTIPARPATTTPATTIPPTTSPPRGTGRP